MKREILCSLLAGAALLMLVACGEKTSAYDATGTFESTELTVSAKMSGELVEFRVEEGAEVPRAAVVGQIDDNQLKLKKEQLEMTKAQLSANQRQLGATRASTDSRQLDLERQVAAIRQQIDNLQRERKRFTELVKDGAVARKQLDDIVYQIKVLEKQLAATQEQVSSNNASLARQSAGLDAQIEGVGAQRAGIGVQQAQLDDQIANAVVKAPIAGIVLEKYVEQGEFVTVGKPLFKLADLKNMILRAYVTSSQLQQVKVGQHVKVMADYGSDQGTVYDGVVTWISSRSEFTPKTIVTEDERADLVYAVKVSVKNDGGIKMGMYGKVKF